MQCCGYHSKWTIGGWELVWRMEAKLHLHKIPKNTQYGEEPALIKRCALGLSLDFISSKRTTRWRGTVAVCYESLKKQRTKDYWIHSGQRIFLEAYSRSSTNNAMWNRPYTKDRHKVTVIDKYLTTACLHNNYSEFTPALSVSLPQSVP